METIRQYLDAMFANLPNTESVLRARDELLQMMEDKYTELIEDGKTENEAVGTVISEFGNLSELAEELGLKEEVEQKIKEDNDAPKRNLTSDEVEGYLHVNADASIKRGIGIALCIASVGFMILINTILEYAIGPGATGAIGLLAMFASIAVGVVVIVRSNTVFREYEYISKEPCSISMEITKNLHSEKTRIQKNVSLFKTIGILMCALCWTPCVLADLANSCLVEDMAAAAIFFLCGLGVLMIVYSAQINLGYDRLLVLNGKETISGNYVAKEEKRQVEYENPVVAFVMSVYWPTIVCLYLIISFLTFEWAWSWVIWPVAAIVFNVIKLLSKKVEE